MTADREAMAALMVAVAERRDKQAFGQLFTWFAPRIKGWLMKSGADPASAEEIAQDTLLIVWHKAGTYKPERASVSTWVFTIARNKRIERIRRERRPEVEAGEPPPDEDYGWDVVAGDTDKLRRYIRELPEAQAEVLGAFYVEGKSHSMIAEEQGIALGTVKSRLRLAMTSLRAQFEPATSASSDAP